jgi:hypothetical protein
MLDNLDHVDLSGKYEEYDYYNEDDPFDLCEDVDEKYIKDQLDGPWGKYLPENVDFSRFFWNFAEVYPRYIIEHNPEIKFRITIPQGKKGYIPHFHMYFDNTIDKKNLSCIRLDKPEYATNHKDITIKKLNNREKEALIQFMNAIIYPIEGLLPFPERSCWDECVRIWMYTHGNEYGLLKENEQGKCIMPNYLLL